MHQHCRTSAIPDRYAPFAESWRLHHPDWEYRLWTDAEVDSLLASEAPELRASGRADAVRCAILRRYGGLLVDLDVECFRPIDPLLDGSTLAIGFEPDAHPGNLLCPAVIASVPAHPFWDHVIAHLRSSPAERDGGGGVETGSVLMTRAFDDFAARDSVRVLPSAELYPVDKARCSDGTLFDLKRWDDLTRDATSHHHWDDAGAGTPKGTATLVSALLREEPLVHNPERRGPAAAAGDPLPLVSALMVTHDRAYLARFAIDCFRRQTYPNKELVIIDYGADDTLAQELARLGDPTIRMIRRPDRDELLGELRNVAVSESAGTYVATWDDDDLSHPLRLELQMAHLLRVGAQVCLLTGMTLWWVDARRFALGEKRLWENSMVCRKDVLPRYQPVQVNEDTPVINRLRQSACVIGVPQPRLYVYAVHGNNSWFPRHFEHFWNAAERQFEGDRAIRLHRELARDLPLDAFVESRSRHLGTTRNTGT